MTLRVVLVVTLLPRGFGGELPMNPLIPVSVSRSRSGRRCAARSGDDVLRRARHLAEDVLRDPQTRRGDGPAAVLEPRSRRPQSSPSKLSDEVKDQALGCGPRWRLPGWITARSACTTRCGRWAWTPVPSTASLARIFREAGVARVEPRKKPRAAYRRFVYPAPNACWQLDATEYVLTGGRKCVIFQLIDDHSRYAVASHVAWGETVRSSDRRGRQGHRRPRGAAAAALRQRRRAEPVPARSTSASSSTTSPRLGRRADHRQTLQTDHPGQERTLPPDPVPLPRQAAARRHARASCRPRSTRSTTSTTPNAPTKDSPAGSPPRRRGRPPRRPRHPAPSPSSPSSSRPATKRSRPARPDRPARRHHRQEADQRRHLHLAKVHLHGRRTTRLPAGPRHHRRRQDHRRRPRRRDPHRAHPTRTRRHLRRQRPTPRTTPQNRETSPKS